MSGATGLLGRALSKVLRREGNEVTRFSRQVRPGYYSISDNQQLSLCEKFVHLGEPANISSYSLPGYQNSRTLSINLKHLIDVFGSSLTYASSGAVYGTSTQTLHSVRDPTFGLDPYTTLKLIHEEMVLDTGGGVLRFSNIFGPTMSEDTVIAKLSQQIRGNLQIPLQQNAVRDYLFVEEAVRAISLTLAKKTPPILNIATGLGRDVNQLVGEIAQVLEIRELRIVREAERQPINCNVLSITETKNVLGWHPSLDFKNQIRRTLFVEKQEK